MLRGNPTVVVIGLALRRLSLFRGFISTNPCLSDRKPQPPKLNPEDVEYKYMRGSGPGGQAMQKSSNAVVAKHLPTGIQSRSHETRSVLRNKSLALASLEFKVDDHFRGEFSAKSILLISFAKLSRTKLIQTGGHKPFRPVVESVAAKADGASSNQATYLTTNEATPSFFFRKIQDENRRKKKLSKMRKTKKKLRKLKERQSESTTDDSQSFNEMD